jgi:CysZ protein
MKQVKKMFDFSYVLKGFGMIFKPGLKRYVIIPMLISILVLSLFVGVGFVQFDNFMTSMMPQEGWLMYLSWLLWPIFALVFLFIIFYGFTFIANLIGAPFNSKLAEAVAYKLDADVSLPESDPFLKDVTKSIGSEIRKILYYLLRAIPLLVLVWIPLTSPVASVVWLLFSAWFLTIEYTGYPLENQKLLFKEQRKLLRKKPISALSFGTGVSVLMFIPILNLAVMPAAVAGATIYWHEKLKT